MPATQKLVIADEPMSALDVWVEPHPQGGQPLRGGRDIFMPNGSVPRLYGCGRMDGAGDHKPTARSKE